MTRRLSALLVLLALLAAACGSRVNKSDAANAQNAQTGGSTTTVAGSDGSSSGGTTFGTLPSPCGPGNAHSATDKGVSTDAIKIGTISDPGGPVPGLDQGIFDSMEAFVDWCNDQGGINGRKLDLTLRDAKLVQFRERVLDACKTDFALVGGGGALDYLGAQDIVDCGLVNVPGFTVSSQAADSDRMYQPMPNPPNSYLVTAGRWIERTHPGVVKHAASVYSNIEVGQVQQGRHQEAYTQLGYKFVYATGVPVANVNYGPVVVAMRNAGVKYFTFTSSYEELVNFQRAMRQQNWKPEVSDLETNFYNKDYPKVGGEAAEGSYVRLTMWPFEEADQNKATRDFLSIMKKYKPNGKIELLGMQAFDAGLLFATAAKKLGDNVTRDRLLSALSKIHEWDGGGLSGVQDPGNNLSGTCQIVMQVHNGGFRRIYPDHGFACPKDGRVTLYGDYGKGAKAKN
jgi:ABC-type branched-subunit amino acid transport system substrate-binding protein